MHDPFAQLGLPRTFDLEPMAVQRAYLARIGAADPADESSQEPLNGAKAILMNPEERAGALLALLGGPSKEADRTLPPGFLPEIMELREQIEGSLEKDAGDPAALERWRALAEERRASHIARASDLFKRAATDETALTALRVELNAWRYTERLLEQLDAAG